MIPITKNFNAQDVIGEIIFNDNLPKNIDWSEYEFCLGYAKNMDGTCDIIEISMCEKR